MTKLIPILLLSLSLACDPAAESCDAPAPVDGDAPGAVRLAPPVELGPADDRIRLREQGPPMGLYVTTLGGDSIHRASFAKMVQACAEQVDPPLTVTLSWYQPDLASDARVVGLGYSMISPASLWECLADLMIANNAVAF